MTFKFKGCTFEDNSTGILAHSDAQVSVDSTKFTGNDRAVFIYNSKDEILEEFFRSGVPLPALEGAANEMRTAHETEYPSILEKYDLSKWIKAGADLSTIGANIMSFF